MQYSFGYIGAVVRLIDRQERRPTRQLGGFSKIRPVETTNMSQSIRNPALLRREIAASPSASGEELSAVVLKAVGNTMVRVTVLAGLCGALAACGVSQLTAPFKGGLFGGGKQETTSTEAVATPATVVGATQTAQTGGNNLTTGSIGCPSFEISSGDRTITFRTPGAGDDSLSVMHRGEITNTARECEPSSGGMTVKYGFSGRVLLGPKGKPGSITLPAKVIVVDGAKSTLKTEKVRVVVNVPAGATAGFFSEVRDIELPMPAGTSPQTYRIYVGFDQSAAGT